MAWDNERDKATFNCKIKTMWEDIDEKELNTYINHKAGLYQEKRLNS